MKKNKKFSIPLKNRMEIPMRLVCDAKSDPSGGPIEDLNGVPIPAELLDVKKSPETDEPLAFPSGMKSCTHYSSTQIV